MTNEFNPFAVQNDPPVPQATPTSPTNKPKSPTFSDSPAPVRFYFKIVTQKPFLCDLKANNLSTVSH